MVTDYYNKGYTYILSMSYNQNLSINLTFRTDKSDNFTKNM